MFRSFVLSRRRCRLSYNKFANNLSALVPISHIYSIPSEAVLGKTETNLIAMKRIA